MSGLNEGTYDDDCVSENCIGEKRMWYLWGAATGQIPIEKVGEMTPREKKFFDGIKAEREEDKKNGKHYIYEMPCSDGSSF